MREADSRELRNNEIPWFFSPDMLSTMYMVKILLAITLVAWFSAPVEVDADCCPCWVSTVCNDGTECTPWCGYGPCNIFGCNCDGGCRVSMDKNIDTEQVS